MPLNAWKPGPLAWRTEGHFNAKRPVWWDIDWAAGALAAMNWMEEEPEVVREYCRGSVAHLDWQALWPRWRSWWAQGLEGMREAK